LLRIHVVQGRDWLYDRLDIIDDAANNILNAVVYSAKEINFRKNIPARFLYKKLIKNLG
jgi:hypothetical protein